MTQLFHIPQSHYNSLTKICYALCAKMQFTHCSTSGSLLRQVVCDGLCQWNCVMAFSNLGEVVLMGAQMSAPLLRATPAVQEIGTRHKPRFLRLYSSNSCTLVAGMLWRYGALNTFTCSCRNCMYSIASQRTDAVSVFPYGETSCCRAMIRSPSFSFLSLAEMDRSALCRLDARVGRLPWSTAQGLLLFSIIFNTFIPYSPESIESALPREPTIKI